MQVNNSVTSIDLRYNNIGDEGLEELAEELVGYPSLASLKLQSSGLSLDGAAVLVESLKPARALRSLDLADNKLPSDWAVQLHSPTELSPPLPFDVFV